MYDGELGVLPGRAALIGRLGPGELRTRTGETVKRYFVDGGFAQVRDNIVTVLTPRAVPAASINRQEAAALVEAPVATNPSAEARLRSQERGRAMLRVAEYAGTSH
jgi:F-type H+-transporting ATPase subunit epsilon